MTIEVFEDIEQGSPEWFELRRGIPTASQFQTLMAKSDKRAGRATYLYKLAGERITGELAESYSNEAMEAGKRDEPELRDRYRARGIVTIKQVAFVRNGKVGCSPDALVEDDGVLEIKRTAPHLLIPMLLEPSVFPAKHYAQCQGALMVTGRKWCDLLVGHPAMPRDLVIRTERNEDYIATLRDEIDIFDLELRRLVEKLK
jgi:hypothetical protein